jgi:hypothetical protein
MRQLPLIFILFFCLHLPGFCSLYVCPDSLDLKVKQIPDSVTRDPVVFAGYLKAVFSSDECVVKALYTWLASNLYYDLDMLENPPGYSSTHEIVMKTLLNRRGVCINYSEVFTAVLSCLKIPVFTINGYTKQDKVAETKIGHAWNAAKLGNTWYLFDATWGGGFVRYERYHKRFSMSYFMMSPDSMICTHMPFDPLWQLLAYPVKHDEFLKGMRKGTDFFNFNDSINSWYTMDTCARCVSTSSRCEKYNISTPELSILKTRYYEILAMTQKNYSAALYNNSRGMINKLTDSYNAFIREKNSGKLNSTRQKSRLASLQQDLLTCKLSLEIKSCPDSILNVYKSKLDSSFSLLEKTINQVAKQVLRTSK